MSTSFVSAPASFPSRAVIKKIGQYDKFGFHHWTVESVDFDGGYIVANTEDGRVLVNGVEIAEWHRDAPKHGWISTKDRLPKCEEGRICSQELWFVALGTRQSGHLVFHPKDKPFSPWFWATDKYDLKDRRIDIKLEDVTHWQPFPELPM